MRRLSQLFSTLLVAFTLAACSGNSEVQSGPLPPSGETAKLRVTNNNWSDMNVYVERGGMRVRLGTVTTMGSRLFSIPRSLMAGYGDVRLIADPIGSRESHVTSPVQVWPGQTVAFRIENHIAVSSVSVR